MMFNIPSRTEVIDQIKNLDYAWNNPKTYAALLIPGISSLVQQIKLSEIAKNLPCEQEEILSKQKSLTECLDKINKLHTLGALVQLVVSTVLSRFFFPLFLLTGAAAAYQAYTTLTDVFNRNWKWENNKLSIIEKPVSTVAFTAAEVAKTT